MKTLIYGDTGTGKTVSLASILKSGKKVRLLASESNAVPGFKKGLEIHKIPETADWAICIPKSPKRTQADRVKQAQRFLTMPLDEQMKQSDPERRKYTRYMEVLSAQNDFVDVNGKSHGTIDNWNEDIVLCIDGLTIICEAIMSAVVGGKIGTSQPEWGAAQKILLDFIRNLTEDLDCHVVLLAHPTKEIDPVLGVQRIYPANLGQALNPLIPTAFSDVIWAYRSGKEFLWSTDHKQAVTRTSHLSISEKLPSDFSPFFK